MTNQHPTQHSIIVRMPKKLHDELAARAATERRSVNSQVVHLIDRYVKKEAA